MNHPGAVFALVLLSISMTWVASIVLVDWLISQPVLALHYFFAHLVAGGILGGSVFSRTKHKNAVWMASSLFALPLLRWCLSTADVARQSGVGPTFRLNSAAEGDVLTYFYYFSLPVIAGAFLIAWVLRRHIYGVPHESR
jgi:hypothetical protein